MRFLKTVAAVAVATLLVLVTGVAAPSGDAVARGVSGSTHAKARVAHRHRASKTRRTAHRSSNRRRSARRGHSRSASYRSHRMSLGASAAAQTYGSYAARSGGVTWSASSGCLDSSLRAVVHQVAAQFGSLRVNSTCRGRAQNRRAGGASHSHHLGGNAVDFRVFSNAGAVAAFLRSHGSVGGYKHYGGGLFHIDTGARRSW